MTSKSKTPRLRDSRGRFVRTHKPSKAGAALAEWNRLGAERTAVAFPCRAGTAYLRARLACQLAALAVIFAAIVNCI